MGMVMGGRLLKSFISASVELDLPSAPSSLFPSQFGRPLLQEGGIRKTDREGGKRKKKGRATIDFFIKNHLSTFPTVTHGHNQRSRTPCEP